MKTKFKLLLLLIPVILTSCEGDDASQPLTVERLVDKDVPVDVPVNVLVTDELTITEETKFDNGFFVSAEGNFGDKNGSISFVTDDLKTSTNFIFSRQNEKTPLGGLIQSITFGEENAYVILNDVSTIVVVDKLTFKKKATITSGLNSPRYMTIIGDKGYVTNWGSFSPDDDFIAVLNLTTNKIEDIAIPVKVGVGRIINKEGKLYVSHGAVITNNIVSVVDINDSNKITTIEVKDGADELFFNASGQLVVLSEGTDFYNSDFSAIERKSDGAISFININTNTITKEIVLPVGKRATLLSQQGDNLYYYSKGKVFMVNSSTDVLPTEGIEVGKTYGMNINNGKLFTASYAFTTFSTLKGFDLQSQSLIFASVVGLGASKIYFSN